MTLNRIDSILNQLSINRLPSLIYMNCYTTEIRFRSGCWGWIKQKVRQKKNVTTLCVRPCTSRMLGTNQSGKN